MSEWVHPEHREVDSLLRNWGRWALSKPHAQHCGSVEHKYRFHRPDDTETGWGDWEVNAPRDPKPLPPDQHKALEVEKLMRHLPTTLRLLLVHRYVHHRNQSQCCRKLRLKFHKFEEYLYRARQMILNLWTARDSGNPTPYHYPLTSSGKHAHNPENPSKTTSVDRPAGLSRPALALVETD